MRKSSRPAATNAAIRRSVCPRSSIRLSSGFQRNDGRSYSRSARYGFGSIATNRSPCAKDVVMVEVAVHEPARLRIERREQLACERNERAPLALRPIEPQRHLRRDRPERQPGRPPEPCCDVDGDRRRLVLRYRREIVPRQRPAARAACARTGREAESPRHRPTARALRPRAATRRLPPTAPSPRPRRPERHRSSSRARTAPRARVPTLGRQPAQPPSRHSSRHRCLPCHEPTRRSHAERRYAPTERRRVECHGQTSCGL